GLQRAVRLHRDRRSVSLLHPLRRFHTADQRARIDDLRFRETRCQPAADLLHAPVAGRRQDARVIIRARAMRFRDSVTKQHYEFLTFDHHIASNRTSTSNSCAKYLARFMALAISTDA